MATQKLMSKPRRNLKIPIILAAIALGFYLVSIYMQYQQAAGGS